MNERGWGMIWALMVVLVFGAFSLSVVQRGRGLMLDAQADRAGVAAYHAANGAIEQARHEVARNAAYAGGKIPIGCCVVKLSVEPEGPGWHVRATANPGGVIVEADLTRRSASDLPAITRWVRHR